MVLEKYIGAVVLQDPTITKDEDLVAGNDRLKSMSNCDDCTALKLAVDELLDLLLSDQVDVGSRFIKNDDLVPAEDCADDADQLLLA